MRDHPEMRADAHPLYLPMTEQGLEAFDLAEIAAGLECVDGFFELHRGRHVANQHCAGTERIRGYCERAAGLGEIEEHAIDAGFVEAGVEIAHLERPVGRVAEECGDVLSRGVCEILAQFIRDDAPGRPDRSKK